MLSVFGNRWFAGHTAVVTELRGRLIKLGTYLLLCGHFSLDPSASQFLVNFLPTRMQDLARSLAKEGQLMPYHLFGFGIAATSQKTSA